MTVCEQLAAFVHHASSNDLSAETLGQLKLRVLDSLACAFGALSAETPRLIRAQVASFGGCPQCRLIGGGWSAPDRAALYNGALVRYLDFNRVLKFARLPSAIGLVAAFNFGAEAA